jgi:hypothetical protein
MDNRRTWFLGFFQNPYPPPASASASEHRTPLTALAARRCRAIDGGLRCSYSEGNTGGRTLPAPDALASPRGTLVMGTAIVVGLLSASQPGDGVGVSQGIRSPMPFHEPVAGQPTKQSQHAPGSLATANQKCSSRVRTTL